MNKKQTIGLAVAAGLFILIGASSVLTNALSKKALDESVTEMLSLTNGVEFNAPKKDYIAVVNVVGTIEEQIETGAFDTVQSYQHVTTLDYIDKLIADTNNKGMLLYVDSPGGAVYESEELYDKLQEYKEKTGRPIWDYMAHYAASGGYMVSMPADKIYANPNTTTGSIGVIMSGFDLTGLYEKLGMRYISITSGKNKDSSKMTDEQIEIYQSQVNECYESRARGLALPVPALLHSQVPKTVVPCYGELQSIEYLFLEHVFPGTQYKEGICLSRSVFWKISRLIAILLFLAKLWWMPSSFRRCIRERKARLLRSVD